MVQKSSAMDLNDKMALLETSLERAADALGDITDPVMERYYSVHPSAQASFREHGLGNTVKLEAEMVESVVYCLMNWLESPQEIGIIFGSTVPHHEQTLHVQSNWFSGLVDAAVYVIVATIPEAQQEEHALWAEIHQGVDAMIADARY
ncbi:hypothetical protein [Parasphingorhabdus cellanae]|uniref:Globin family profile domain-containing protein n=1 Tax=Parasphingorhabdus cellanae TaxID=2806553 RepID=A0ABX7T5L8_9SPHN|nr:hypothetical protein [Parasphingorhabdus cellanae]QTD56836.1 hypothetical protein J4G78_04470 [Parasphingorhabdus cellanae]